MDTTLARPPIGQVLDGRYRVESHVARGGMATVYLGTDTRLDRTVALKIMHAEFANDEEFVRRFVSEARSVAKLSHPNVVTVYDQGADGRILYLAMEYVPGQTLRDLLRDRGRLTAREALDIMDGVLAGLGAAHDAGLAHRDVKPENVLLTRTHAAKVADFGLARVVSGARHTKSGMIIGTAAYLAPEQVSGATGDARTDVYAAGVMLFELLTGTQPHTGDAPLDVAYKHVNEVVPPPSSLVPDVPPALDTLVALATSRDPELRPGDAGQFLRAAAGARHNLSPGSVMPAAPERSRDPAGDGTSPLGVTVPPASPDPSPPAWPDPSPPAWPDASPPAWPDPPVSRPAHDLIPGMAPPPARQSFGGMREGTVSGPPATEQFPRRPYRQDFPNKTLIVSGVDAGAYDPPPPRYPREPRLQGFLFGRKLGYLAAALVVAVIVGVFAWWQTTGRFTTVPKVSGMTIAAARSELRGAGFTVTTGKPRLDNQVTKGQVILTVPAAGARIAKNGRVTLIMSAGPHMLPVPQVTGRSLAAARAALKHAGLLPGHVRKEPSATVPAGIVISTRPAAGASWPQPRPVSLMVSAGPPIPNFVGQQKTVAEAWAAQYDATLNEVPNSKSSQPPGTVISQSPAAGSQFTRREVITVTISAGPQMVAIPNVDGMKVQQAVHTLQQLGFKTSVTQVGPFNAVFHYTPTGQAPQGATITLYAGLPSVGGG